MAVCGILVVRPRIPSLCFYPSFPRANQDLDTPLVTTLLEAKDGETYSWQVDRSVMGCLPYMIEVSSVGLSMAQRQWAIAHHEIALCSAVFYG